MEIKEKKKKKKSFKKKLLRFIKSIPSIFKEIYVVLRLVLLLFFVAIKYILDRGSKQRLNKPRKENSLKNKIGRFYQGIYNKVLKHFDFYNDNDIRASDLIFLALKNLSTKKNRTFITIGGMALGFAAVILLLSIGYGFEKLIVSRVASLAEMKQVDVTVSQGAPLLLSSSSVEEISEISNVEEVLPIIESVSKINYNNAVSDVVIYGVSHRYFEESGIKVIMGNVFEDSDIDLKSQAEGNIGVVAGASSTLVNKEALSVEISKVNYSLLPLKWKAVYKTPDTNSELLGYTKREVGTQDGVEVWGQQVESDEEINSAFDVYGDRYSPWIKDSFLLWEKALCSSEDPDCVDLNYKVIREYTAQKISEGYITESDVNVERYEIYENSSLEIYNGRILDQISFEIEGDRYTDFSFESDASSLTSTILSDADHTSFEGELIYGGFYSSQYSSVTDSSGNRYSYWVKSNMKLWKEKDCNGVCDVYYNSDDDNLELEQYEVYFKMSDIDIKDFLQESLLSSNVLGESDTTETENNTDFIDLDSISQDEEDGIDWATISLELGNQESIDKEIKEIPKDAQRVALVNTAMLELLGIDREEAIDKEFESTVVFDSSLFNKLNYVVESEPVSFKIIGIVTDSKTPSFYINFNDLWVEGIQNVSQLKIIVDSQDDVGEVRGSVESIGFNTSSIVDTVDSINSLFVYVRIGLLILGLIALGVASLGMFNTLTVSLMEKTREVGLLKAMGLKSNEVKILFLAESIIISVFGGGAGLVLGFVLGKLIGVLISIIAIVQGQSYIDVTHIPWALAISMVVGSSIIGILTGWYPSKRATEISALDALRYE